VPGWLSLNTQREEHRQWASLPAQIGRSYFRTITTALASHWLDAVA
jgi:hypothetical protein